MGTRARVLAPLALCAVSVGGALALTRVADMWAFVAPVVVAALVPFVIGALGRWRGWPGAVVLGISTVVLIAFVAWAFEASTTRYGIPLGDTWDTVGAQLRHGYHTLRQSDGSIPATDGVVLLGVVAVWVTSATADWLAFNRHAVLGALAPGLVLFVWSSYLDAFGSWALSALVFAVLAALFVYAQNLALLDRRRTWLVTRGTARAPSVLPTLLAVVLAVGAALALASTRSDARAVLPLDFLPRPTTPNTTYNAGVAPLVDVRAKLGDSAAVDVFTVRAPRGAYWRITALDHYSAEGGGQWTLDASGGDAVAIGLDHDVPAGALHQVFAIDELRERWLPAAFEPVAIDLEDTLVVRSSSTLVTTESSVQGLHYTVDSALGPTEGEVTPAQKAATAAPVPPELRQYTDLPAGFSTRVSALAELVVRGAGATTPYAQAEALRNYFRSSGFVYDTTVDLGQSGDATEEFLRTKRGFCVQFASAYALMARSLGIPTRVAVGFTPGARTGDSFTVTSHNAHAWPEVWLAGLGWTSLFDPTPAVSTTTVGGSAVPGEKAIPPAASGQPQVPTTTLPTVTAPAGGTSATGAPSTGAGGQTAAPATLAPARPTISTDSSGDSPITRVIAIAVGALVLVVAAYVAAVLLVKRRRRARRRSGTPARAVQGAWEEALDRLEEADVRADPALTPLELARVAPAHTSAAAAPPLHALARTYSASRYGNVEPSDEAAVEAWASVVALERALDAPLSPRKRWLRRLSPASLRPRASAREELVSTAGR